MGNVYNVPPDYKPRLLDEAIVCYFTHIDIPLPKPLVYVNQPDSRVLAIEERFELEVYHHG